MRRCERISFTRILQAIRSEYMSRSCLGDAGDFIGGREHGIEAANIIDCIVYIADQFQPEQ